MWMHSLKRTLLLALAAATFAVGQPALTPIQDILYRADGSRFNGTLSVKWNSFLAGDTSNIATSNLTLQIVNGVLRTNLVPTTTASAGAQYNITYNMNGINQFTEVWAVPPSTVPLRVRDVRVSQGSIVGPAPVTSPTQISDVTGLSNELLIRPIRGAGFAIGRTAIINQAGQLDGAVGNLTDCVRVDGSSGPCSGSSGSGSLIFVNNETPSGTIDGTNTAFLLAFAPSPPASLQLFRNGLQLSPGIDYILSNRTVMFFLGATPVPGDVLSASYRYGGNISDPSVSYAQVFCSSTGGSTNLSTAQQLGTCTLPANSLNSGDRVEILFQFGHTGASSSFTGEVRFGSTSTILRTAGTADAALVGKVELGIGQTGQTWDVESWGAQLAQSAGAGSSTEDITQSITVSFRGNLTTTLGDSISLKNFTIIRYPAQSNP
jgi:hypothetical protein